MAKIQVTFTPADFEALSETDLSGTTCVVFDVLRATSSMITALANGAECIIPVATVEEALEKQAVYTEALLCGERYGRRITAKQTGGVNFVLGNSPREYTADNVAGKTLITTTTNGTRALRACQKAGQTLLGSFLNLQATIDHLRVEKPERLVLVCGGTFEEAAMEDALAAGAVADAVWDLFEDNEDSAQIARVLYQSFYDKLGESIQIALNARRLLEVPELAEDVSFCFQQSIHDFVVLQDDHGLVRIL